MRHSSCLSISIFKMGSLHMKMTVRIKLLFTLILASIFVATPVWATNTEALVTLQEALIYFEEGSGDISGVMELIERALRESTEGEAANNPVFQQIAKAAEAMQKAQENGTAKDLAAAKAEIANAGVTAAEELDKNPALDETTKKLNEADKNAFITAKAAAEAEMQVAELVEVKEAAQEAGNTEAAAAADAALGAIEEKVEALQEQAQDALETVTAEEPPDEAKMNELAETAAAADAAVENIIEDVNNTPGVQEAMQEFVPPSDEPPADEPPADEPPSDEPPADEPPADEPPSDEPPPDDPEAYEPPEPEPEPEPTPDYDPTEDGGPPDYFIPGPDDPDPPVTSENS
jgi:hypothetical protein